MMMVLLGAVMPEANPLRHPNIEIQAVLRDVRVGVPHLLALEAGEVLIPFLVAAIGERGGVEDVVPRLDGHRPVEAQRPDWRLRERDAVEHVDVAAEDVLGEAPHEARGGFDNQRIAAKVPRGCRIDQGQALHGPRGADC